MNSYVFPALPKSGLGNLLWIWAKSLCWAHERGLPLLAPRWHYVEWRRYIKGIPDKRSYRGFFSSSGYICGFEKYLILATHKHVTPDQFANVRSSCVIVFNTMGAFTPLIGRHKFVAQKFYEMVNEPHLPDMSDVPSRFIGLHVRCGDFQPYNPEALAVGKSNIRQPLEWYRDCLREGRRRIGVDLPAVVFSDGNARDLSLLLNEPGVQLSPCSSPLADLILMARSSLLIGSRSSFSLWASYIGQMPVVYFRGARPWHEAVVSSPEEHPLEVEWMPGDDLPDNLMERALRQQSRSR